MILQVLQVFNVTQYLVLECKWLVTVGSVGSDLKPATFDPFWGFNHFDATHIGNGVHSEGNKPLDFGVIALSCRSPRTERSHILHCWLLTQGI